MFTHRTLYIWIGILCLSGMFLLGQDSWPPAARCIDVDGDGYGSDIEGSDLSLCDYPGLVDCDDSVETGFNVNPGADEGENYSGTCEDGLDNNCNGTTDINDWFCDPCYDDDDDGYGTEESIHCDFLQIDCNDDNDQVHPGQDPEGPLGHDSCTDGFDNECDGLTDIEEADCIPCEDFDEDGVGINDSVNCPNPGFDCDDENDQVYPGQVEEDFGSESCRDGFDNDCDDLVDLEDGACFNDNMMVDLDAGTFNMGDSHDGCAQVDECTNNPPDPPFPHPITLSAFSIDVHEVTNKEYSACVGADVCAVPAGPWGGANPYYDDPANAFYPFVYVNYDEAIIYCEFRGKRLPTEAEWEYAARGGGTYKYATGTDVLNGSQANYKDSGDGEDNGMNRVGTYPPNSYGIFNMTGNVQEWVSDWYSASYYSISPAVDPQGLSTGSQRVYRGGHWNAPLSSDSLRVANRAFAAPYPWAKYNTLGFRCAKDID